jgi:hypothetical protein
VHPKFERKRRQLLLFSCDKTTFAGCRVVETGGLLSASNSLNGAIYKDYLMHWSISSIPRNLFVGLASIAMASVVGCASHSSSPSTLSVPPNTVAPTPSSIRDLGDLQNKSATMGGSGVSEKTLTGGAVSRGFDFGDNGGGGGGGGAGPVTFEQLGQMLAGIGGNPQVNNNVYLFQIKDDSGITYPLGIFLSQDQRAIYFFIPLVNLDQSWVNQDALLKLLSANSSICPACFGILTQRLALMMGIPNSGVTPDLLKQALSYVFETVHRTQPLWGPWVQSSPQQQQGGGGEQGGGGPGGPNPGGPGQGQGGGTPSPSNPFQ